MNEKDVKLLGNEHEALGCVRAPFFSLSLVSFKKQWVYLSTGSPENSRSFIIVWLQKPKWRIPQFSSSLSVTLSI